MIFLFLSFLAFFIHMAADWKDWAREVLACSQGSGVWSSELSLRGEQTDVRACGDWLLSDAKKGRNLADSEWRGKKLSPFNDYFQNDEDVDKMIHQNEFVADVFTGQKSVVLKKFDDKKIWWWKKFNDVKFKILWWWWNNVKTLYYFYWIKKIFISKSINLRIFFPSFSEVVDSFSAWADPWFVTYRRMK